MFIFDWILPAIGDRKKTKTKYQQFWSLRSFIEIFLLKRKCNAIGENNIKFSMYLKCYKINIRSSHKPMDLQTQLTRKIGENINVYLLKIPKYFQFILKWKKSALKNL